MSLQNRMKILLLIEEALNDSQEKTIKEQADCALERLLDNDYVIFNRDDTEIIPPEELAAMLMNDVECVVKPED